MEASTNPILVNRAQAEQVAQIFMRHRHIHGVELFGSVARDGQGHDLDLILVTDEVRGLDFLIEVAAKLRRRPSDTESLTLHRIDIYNNPWERMWIAQDVLGHNFNELLIEAEELIRHIGAGGLIWHVVLDIFVFPSTWRERLNQLQKDIPHSDPNFMQNIARDAVRIA